MKRKYSLSALALALVALPASGQLLITQYSEGASFNKYIELTNTGSETIDLSSYTLTLWSNANNNESWKSDGAAPTSSEILSGTLAAGASYVLANSRAATPLAADQADLISGVANFNGNDSVILYNGLVGEVANIADAIAATTANEAANLSILRRTVGVGFDTTAGSSFLEFSDVWATISNEEADAAVAGSDAFLGASTLGMSLPGLSVSVDPNSFSEGAGANAATGTVTRSGDLTSTLEVSLSVSDDTEASVPASVTIPANASSADFAIDAIDDEDQDSAQSVRVFASADGFTNGNADLTVEDDESAIPTISLSADMTTLAENAGMFTVTLTISSALTEDSLYAIASSDISELDPQLEVTLPANATTVTFPVMAVDDDVSDGSQVVTLTVSDPNSLIADATLDFTITDDEDFTPPDLVINELRIDNVGRDDQEPDVNEYLEIYGATADFSLDRVWLIVLGDAGNDSRFGNVDRAYNLTGTTASGNYFVIGADPMPVEAVDFSAGINLFENGDSLTFLLVTDFTGAQGEDLDADDDGTLDSTPWGSVLDAVSSVQSAEAEDGEGLGYAAAFDGTDVTQAGAFPPAHLFRSPDGTGAWQIGPFQDAPGDPDAVPPIEPVIALDTPKTENGTVVPPVEEVVTVIDFSLNAMTGRAVMTVVGLGDSIYVLQSSNDLGQEDVWVAVPGGFSESDNDDGSTDLNFTFNIDDPKLFYRLVEQP